MLVAKFNLKRTNFQTNKADDPCKKYIIYRRRIEQYYLLVFYHVNVR